MLAHGTITIQFDEDEINLLWNVVMFAKDLHNERTKKGEPCMTENELRLADALIDLTERIK